MTDVGIAAPRFIGPYEITGVLGEGGMGVVYAAEQAAPLRRSVAIKLLRGGTDSDEVLRRFEAERQALALMEHPGIARVYDAGTTEDGLPYFVMERVEGVAFTAWCDTHRLTTRERLRLFIPLCHAIQHAHQKGVIHRDLKPSNVLVTAQSGEPSPKVIDFGIARAVDRKLGGDTMLTLAGMAIGTPAYMSPEQAEGAHLDVDTRSDVYALGVMFYEVLAGALPVDPAQVGLLAFIARLVARHTLPPLPSARLEGDPQTASVVAAAHHTDPGALARELRGDLDAIALKSMALERELRYQTAAELAEDIERYLAHEPVRARTPSRAYRATKFVRRHPTGVALAASAMIFLVSLATVATVQANRVSRARASADRRRVLAENLVSFMTGPLRDSLAPLGKLALFDEVDRRAVAYFAGVPSTELSSAELFARSQSLSGIGQVHMAKGNLDLAMVAFRNSLDQVRALAARDTNDSDRQMALGAAYFWIGNVHLLRSRLDSALAEFDEYLGVARGLVRRDSLKPEWQLELGYAHSNLGSVLEAKGDLARAIEEFRYTLGVKRKLVALDPKNRDWQVDLGVSENTLGRALERAGQLDSAEVHYRADLAIRAAAARAEPSNAVWRERLVPAITYLGSLELLRGRVASARVLADSAAGVARALAAGDAQNADKAREAATSELYLARVRLAEGDAAMASALASSARSTLARIASRDTSNADYRTQLGIASIELARARAAAGDFAGAREMAAEAERQLAGASAARERLELARARAVLGAALAGAGRPAEARLAREGALAALGADAARDELLASAVRAEVLTGLGHESDAAPITARLRAAGVRASPVAWSPVQ